MDTEHQDIFVKKENSDSNLESNSYDIVIIGGGAAGFSAASVAAEAKLRVAMINDGLPIGGTCVNVGCVPSKILIEMGNRYYYTQFQGYDSLKGKCTCSAPVDFGKAVAEKNRMVETFRENNYIKVADRFPNLTIIKGLAKFVSRNLVEVNGVKLKADKFIITTGTRPRIFPIPGLKDIKYLTSREALDLPYLPKTLLVMGAGAIGLEIAQLFLHFGSKVIVIEKETQILPRIEPEIANDLQYFLEEEGIEFYLDVDVKKVYEENKKKIMCVTIDGKEQIFSGDELLVATGVSPNTEGLGLDLVGVEVTGGGFIKVDKEYKTTTPNIWAAGDVVGNMFIETIAAKEGYLSATNAINNTHKTIDYDTIPSAVFTTPQVATVGLTEQEFIKRFNDCLCRSISYSQIPKAEAILKTRGTIKMIIHPETNVIFGVHIVGPMAADLIHEATLAVKYKLTIDDIIDTVHVFPTMSEGIKRVAQSFKRDISLMTCCVN
jgi:mercuric reductase